MTEYLIEHLRDIAAVVGYITAITVFVTSCFKPVRKRVGSLIRKVSRTDEQQAEIDSLHTKIDKLVDMMSEHVEKDGQFRNSMSDSIDALKAGSAISLGNVIKDVYNHYEAEKQIPEKEYEIVDKAYTIYHDRLGGNGVIERIFKEMKTWHIQLDSQDHE